MLQLISAENARRFCPRPTVSCLVRARDSVFHASIGHPNALLTVQSRKLSSLPTPHWWDHFANFRSTRPGRTHTVASWADGRSWASADQIYVEVRAWRAASDLCSALGPRVGLGLRLGLGVRGQGRAQGRARRRGAQMQSHAAAQPTAHNTEHTTRRQSQTHCAASHYNMIIQQTRHNTTEYNRTGRNTTRHSMAHHDAAPHCTSQYGTVQPGLIQHRHKTT